MKCVNYNRFCDRCHKFMDKWESVQIVKRTYNPGGNFETSCCSDIENRTKKIANLCPKCYTDVEKYILGGE